MRRTFGSRYEDSLYKIFLSLRSCLRDPQQGKTRRTTRLATCSDNRKHFDLTVPTTLSLRLHFVFITHDLINENNGGHKHYLLSQTTLKNTLRIYYYYSLLMVLIT